MAKKTYEEAAVQDIADAIREKTGSTEKYKIAQMGNAVRGIPNGGSTFTDDGEGNISVDGATAQSVNQFLQSLTFPGLNFKYINPLNSGTYSNPYGVYVGSGASLVDTILAKTAPGVYTVYMNRNATDVPAAAAAASSSLRGLVVLSQIKKHYAIILLVDQLSNFYVQYIQDDVGGGWKQMPDSSAADNAVLYTPQTLTDAQKKQARENVDAASDFVIIASTGPNDTITVDKTFAQILEAISGGQTPVMKLKPSGVSVLYDVPFVAFTGGVRFEFSAPIWVDNLVLITIYVTSTTVELVQSKPILFDSQGHMPQAEMVSAPTSDMEIANKKYVDDSVAKKLNQTEPLIKEGLTIESGSFAIYVQPNSQTSATGEDFASLLLSDSSPQATGNGIVIGGLANFGDAEAVGLEDTAVSYAQLTNYTKPLMLTYDNNKVTGASYYEIHKAIERGRQIKLAVANTADIIATNAKNETDKSVLKFIETDVGGDTVFFKQYYVTAQTSGITVNVKSMELP